jgi:hypothetical protein
LLQWGRRRPRETKSLFYIGIAANLTDYFGGEKSDGTFSTELWEYSPPFFLVKIEVTDGPEGRKDHAAFFKDKKFFIRGGAKRRLSDR